MPILMEILKGRLPLYDAATAGRLHRFRGGLLFNLSLHPSTMASYIINGSSQSRLGRLRGKHTLSRSAQGRLAVVTRFLWSYLPDW
jgi:hypothetical protein